MMSDSETITEKRLKEILAAEFLPIKSEIANLHDDYLNVKKQSDKHDETLYGNGKTGMDENIRNISTWVDGEKKKKAEEEKEKTDTGKYYLRLTVGTAITSIVILIINGIVYFIKILPVLNELSK